MSGAVKSTFDSSAYGGAGWSPRTAEHTAEVGTLWAPYRVGSEWAPLDAVLLHAPDAELAASADPAAAQMLEVLDIERARDQHAALADVYRDAGVAVHFVEPEGAPSPNQMFCADLFFMTPDGAVLARPASTVRAGEERWVARRLAALGVPILGTLQGRAVFEGADAMWLDGETVAIARGLRTNQAAIEQIENLLAPMGVGLLPVDLPYGTMHLMGMFRMADRDLAICWPRRTPHALVMALRERQIQVAFLPDEDEAQLNRALNFVTLGPRRIVMVAGNTETQAFYEGLGIQCQTVPADELAKAAGAVGCLTGILSRRS